MTAAKSPKQSFTATLEPLRNNLGWVIARIPFDVAATWPVRNRLRVRGQIADFAFRSSLFAFSSGAGHFLLVNKQMQKAAAAQVGSAVRIQLEPDLEERPALIPSELAKALKADRSLTRYLASFSPSMQREIGKWVYEPESAATRRKRAEKMAERLLFTMEGELHPPPVLRAAFERQPQAAKGWAALTATQRRGHLLGISAYESVESRERRAAKAVEDAVKAGARASAKASTKAARKPA